MPSMYLSVFQRHKSLWTSAAHAPKIMVILTSVRDKERKGIFVVVRGGGAAPNNNKTPLSRIHVILGFGRYKWCGILAEYNINGRTSDNL